MTLPLTPTDAEAAAVANGLLAGSWPVADWRHPHHVIATAWLIRERPDLDLDAELPGVIRRYNVAQGGVNSDSAGYHHTITVFYLEAIRAALAAQPPGLPIGEACGRLLAGPLGDKDHILSVYPRELLFTPKARLDYVAPPQNRRVRA